ncbi:protein kinase [Kitasatospora aureofaciens]|uniref:non-specific serine/threonine protein kinase n=2 Tax=Kitasatospora aureofaciens TaxID=1894 RepID=A0A1E7NCE3_KITAU|nr:serine/threonine-protein kinase [Kitasatospora aureofaciens]ARF80148.1 serine/threonine protein kinase [Kitasatospora aureofaciens]OEV38328.1 serine/threonine protein kinase [Kitasatospora aureofaciens]GGU97119.1 serine/threonine-protein kinase PkaA [Kitasatospora aureofaciens]
MRPVGSKYLLEETLGRGATGTVWRGLVRQDVQVPGSEPGQQVAIKVLREELAADPDVVMRFLRERSLLLRLSHPNIVRVRDLVVEGELLALVMDLVEGPDLARYLRANGPFSPIAGALLMAQVADALAASHADGIVHRDLKPANVLLASTVVQGTEQMHPMLTDFGIARLADSPGVTRTHEFVGTPAYVAPESAEGRPQTSAVDVYGAGIMLYELVTGRQPFQGDSALAVLQAHLAQEPQRPSTMPEPLWTVIERCLRKDPAQRPSATALARALRVVAAGVGVHASPAAVDEALAVGALLLPDPQPTAVPGVVPVVPGGPGGPGGPAGAEDRTQVLPPASGGPQYDPAAATRVMGTQPPPAPPYGTQDRTQVMPPTAVPPPPPAGPPAPQEEAPHPWQTQLRAARDRNQQTQVGHFGPEDFEDPQVAPPPYQAGQGGPGHQQPPAGPRADQRRQGPPPGYAQRPPVAPPPYQVNQGAQGNQGGRPQPQGGYRQAPAGYGRPQGDYPPPPPPPAAAPRRSEPPAPQYREPRPPREEPREPSRRESAPPRERRPRSRNRMYIPGLGCLKGCLMVLLVLAVAAIALWNFTPLPHYWDNVVSWFDTARDWVTSVFGSSSK